MLADEWKPFVPGFTPQRQFETYPQPQRPESSRQFFGKTSVEPIQQNLYKKSFQTAASANNIEPYAVPPILGSFNTFGLQTIQARNPLLEKNIKDNQYLDQGSHLQPKYYPQNSQQPQRFPPPFIPPQQQYVPNQQQYVPNQQQHYQNQYRLENQIKQQPLVQSPSRNIQTSVQIFPPNPPNHYQPNAYFLGVPQKQENYEDDSLSRKQNLHRPTNDFLLNTNNIATIYGSRDPAQNIAPPALKPTPFIRNEQQDPFLFENPNLKAVQRYETPNAFKRPYEPQQIKQEPNRRPEDNPSKQVYEQLSHFGRPFSLPREPVTEGARIKPENPELDQYQRYGNPVEHYKKDKLKPSQLHSQKTTYGREPVGNAFGEVSTTSNLLLDYEPGKLQSVKTVTYSPQRDVLQFNEEDVPGGAKPYQNDDKYNSYTRTPFLPTPTESEEDPGYGNFQRLTTPPQKLTSTLPKNHKYVSMHHGTRNRYHQNYVSQEPPKYYTSTEPQQSAFEEKVKYASTQAPEYEEPQYETTTRKSSGRRRKPSKGTKNKDQTRQKMPSYADASTTSAINHENYYVTNDISTEAPIQHTTKKKQTKITTSKPEDDYPNYPQYVKQENYPQDHPNYPQYVKQQENYPKEYYQSTSLQNTYDNADTGPEYYNSEKQEEKENYPQTHLTTLSTTTTTTTPEPSTTAPLKARIKNKYSNSTRPRFSIKDYKRTTTASTQSIPSTTEAVEQTADTEKKNVRKFAFASRSKNKTEPIKTSDESTSESIRKYKPRTRPSKYRTTSTTVAADTTTERVYTFKPSTSNRYKTSTSKYYNRFRTTTEIASNDAEEPSVASSDKKPIRTMLFSAKRSSLLRSKSTTTPKAEETDDIVEETDDLPSPTIKKTTQYKPNTKLEKADDASQTDIMTSSEEQNEKKEIKDATKKNDDTKESIDITTSSEEEMDDFSDMLDVKENEVTTSSNLSAVSDDRMDDADKVSKVSSLTSIDESDLPMSFFQKWTSNDNQKQ